MSNGQTDGFCNLNIDPANAIRVTIHDSHGHLLPNCTHWFFRLEDAVAWITFEMRACKSLGVPAVDHHGLAQPNAKHYVLRVPCNV